MRGKDSGVGLVEVLVTSIVLSVGFLLIARMQVDAMRSQRAALHESHALMLATGMMDRMRDNLAGVASGAYDGKSTSSALAEPACVVGGACSPGDLAATDLHEWSARLSSMRGATHFVPALPGSADGPATGSIGIPVDGTYPVSLSWTELRDGEETERTLTWKFVP